MGNLQKKNLKKKSCIHVQTGISTFDLKKINHLCVKNDFNEHVLQRASRKDLSLSD